MASEASILPDSCPLAELGDRAEALLQGKAAGVPPEKLPLYQDAWLRWSQAGGPGAEMRWSFLAKRKPSIDRDAYVLDLWRSLETTSQLKAYVEEKSGPWEHYQRHFFGWFLGRFNLPAARRVFPKTQLAAAVSGILAALAVGAALWAFRPGISLERSIPACGLFLAAALALDLAVRMPPWEYVLSLIPRLAATMGIGYLFLASAPQLVRVFLESHRPPWQSWTASGALLAGAFAYVVIHVARRVHPRLAVPLLLLRSMDLLLLAMTYAVACLLLAAPLLFSASLLYGPAESGKPLPGVCVHPHHLVLCAAVALNLGVILQLAWDEKPLTEPL